MYTFTSPVEVWEIPFLNMPKLPIFFNKTSFQESILPETTLVYFFFQSLTNLREEKYPVHSTLLVPCKGCWCCSVAQSYLDSLQPHGLPHAGFLCPSPSPRVFSNSCPLSW